HVNTRAPVEGLIDERNRVGAAASEYDRTDGDPSWVLPGGINGRTLFCGSSEPRIRMCRLGPSLLGNFWCPMIALPVNAFRGRLICHAFPPDASVGSECDIGENAVLRERCHCVGIGFNGSTRPNSKKSRYRIDGAKTAQSIRSNPGDGVAH